MKILVIGAKGQLGCDLVEIFGQAGHAVTGTDIPEIDITDQSVTSAFVGKCMPDVIVNPAAFTAVDDAEKKAELAYKINETGAAIVAQAAREVNALLIHLSTDYVFDGTKAGSYTETDRPNPQTIYGKSKLAGEERIAEIWPRHLIWRIAWLYGSHGQNFVKTMLRIGRQNAAAGKILQVVDDQHGCPTCTTDVCRQLLGVLGSTQYGVYHGTSEGACSWYEFASYIFKKYGVPCTVAPCTTAEFPRPAPRPANSVLENSRLKALGINTMPHWRDAFDAFYAGNQNLTV